ncbi:MAG: SDR family oxidoreductase [Bacteroidia bacterium]|nr:SDR family oxidoreductase [Bacteroidia bacterium]
MKVTNKTIVVTGGGNGIGRELVLLLLSKGARVAALDIREPSLRETEKLAGENSRNLSLHVLDISDYNAVLRVYDEVISRFGNVDGVINNAGIIQPFVRINDLGFEAIEKVMTLNFYGTLYIIKVFLPHLLKRSEAHIMNISSMGGFLPVPGQSVYCASKAAVKLLTEVLYAELMNTQVKVSVVFPGAIATEITQNSGVDRPKVPADNQKTGLSPMSPVKAAEKILKGMENNEVRIYVGNDSLFLNFLYRLAPGFATRFISRQMKSLLPD